MSLNQIITLKSGVNVNCAQSETAKKLVSQLSRDEVKELCYRLYEAIGYYGSPLPGTFGQLYHKRDLIDFAQHMLDGNKTGFRKWSERNAYVPTAQQQLEAIKDTLVEPPATVEPDELDEPSHVLESNRPEIDVEFEPDTFHGANGSNGANDVVDDLRRVFGRLGIQAEQIDHAKIRELVFNATRDRFESFEAHLEELITKGLPRRIEVVQLDKTVIDVGIAHHLLPVLKAMVECRQHVALVGPAGTGKTFAAEQVATALGLKFDAISVGPQTTQSHLMGYMNADGKYIETAFRRCFEHGGIILIDEADAGHPGVMTCINAATANHGCGFPDKYVLKHPDFVVVVAMNTYGKGASRDYVGRNPLDGATLDRFSFLDWPVDEVLELHLCTNKEWCNYVQRIRHSLSALSGIRHLVTPRASFNGARLLAAGIDRKTVEQAVIWKGLGKTEIDKIMQGTGLI